MSEPAQRIDRARIGESVRAEVLRYDDGDVTLHDAEQVESGYLKPRGTVVFTQSQLQEFTTTVAESSIAQDAPLASVEHVETGKVWSLGTDRNGNTATLKRNMEQEFYFSTDGGDECVLTVSQAQGFYEYLVEAGYS